MGKRGHPPSREYSPARQEAHLSPSLSPRRGEEHRAERPSLYEGGGRGRGKRLPAGEHALPGCAQGGAIERGALGRRVRIRPKKLLSMLTMGVSKSARFRTRLPSRRGENAIEGAQVGVRAGAVHRHANQSSILEVVAQPPGLGQVVQVGADRALRAAPISLATACAASRPESAPDRCRRRSPRHRGPPRRPAAAPAPARHRDRRAEPPADGNHAAFALASSSGSGRRHRQRALRGLERLTGLERARVPATPSAAISPWGASQTQ